MKTKIIALILVLLAAIGIWYSSPVVAEQGEQIEGGYGYGYRTVYSLGD